MAGFGVFRNYQKASLVALAILSMLAFFVLPPLLQYGGQAASVADTPVAKWAGGEIREKGLDRAVTMKLVVNRFLAEAVAAAGRDPAQAPRFAADELSTVRTMLLADEARKNGIVVSDAAINDFLDKLTSGQVRAEQFEQIMQGLRAGGGGVSQHDLFEAIRTELLAQHMQILLQRGFAGDPPGLRWDYFRRMEQSATVELVPIDVRAVGDDVKLPAPAVLRSFFEKHKDDLPDPRSDKPGFREPHRARVEYFVAKPGVFLDETTNDVTEEEIVEFYEAKKEAMFRAKPADAASKAPATPSSDEQPAAESAAPETPAAAAPAEGKPAEEPKSEAAASGDAVPAPEAPAAAPETPAPAAEAPAVPTEGVPPAEAPKEGSGANASRSPFRTVSYQDADAPAKPADEPAAAEGEAPKDEAAPAAVPATETPASAAPADAAAAVTPDAAAATPPAVEYEPLEAVRERIRETIAREKADAKVEVLFRKIADDVTAYTESYALWQAKEEARGIAPPRPPDVAKIAATVGLEGARSELQSIDQAYEAGGLGRSFEFVPDPGSRFGVRQLNWIEMIYGQGALGMRPVRSRDMEGNRYLSWRVEDQPEFTPTFETARPSVEAAWKIVEGRSLARKRAEEVARRAEGKESLEAAVAGDESMQVLKAGPFFWINPQAAMSGMAQVSQPAGIVMPGPEFMETVFGLEPGKVGVAFNEPKTVCYCVRLIDVEPPADKLKERFIASRGDPRATGVVAQDTFARSFEGWVEGLESRYGLEWKRKPRR